MAFPVAVVLLGLLCLSGLDAEHRECPLLGSSSAGPSSLFLHPPRFPKRSFLATGRDGAGRGVGGSGVGASPGLKLFPSFSASRGGGWVGVPGETTGTPGRGKGVRVARDQVSASW